MTQAELEQLIKDQAALIAQLKGQLDTAQAAADAEYQQVVSAPPLAERPCSFCQQIHDPNPTGPPVCRCIYCNQIGPIGGSTTDPRLGTGPVCYQCLGPVRGSDYLKTAAQTVEGIQPPSLPWEIPQ